ncbi:MAG TPA: cysteine--tRNA ligase [Candidatus Egerieicola pullicola]|uniref:Cysteine--tRNA ligase n=1 Tax=Candidatus Egerieicola pullicola TaxID=2840775 RepID=A0A9D1AJB9_9FIRM|nr:cysteine--tRNA ligase [Candidatus Egerieicola pullicola]
MEIYNTLTRKKETFVPMEEGKVKMYCCGPTVYNFIHIGNARPICLFDVFRRYLEFRGYHVTFVQNFTDVDDKIIKKANEEGVTAAEIAQRYIKEYETDAKGLGVRPATVHPTVTGHIPDIIDIIQTLIDKGHAYQAGGDVYYRTRSFPEYGKLSHMPIDELESGARIAVGEQKEDPLDFALWKAAKPGEPYWDSPWGQGRPGWHIECSAMNRAIFGDTIDIHCGGQDLIFPHHENEIAQSEGASGKPFAHYWMHNGYINVDNVKMSKSLGNFFTVREVAEKFGYEPIKFMMLQAHYRSPINYTLEVIQQCQASLKRIYNCKEKLTLTLAKATEGAMTQEQKDIIDGFRQQFIAAMDDDFNTADAVSAIFELVRQINTDCDRNPLPSKEYFTYAQTLFDTLLDVMGIVIPQQQEEQLPVQVQELVERRAQARKEKNFALADQLRDEIAALGYEVKETRQGTQITKK